MAGQRIDAIEIEGYLSIRSAHVELRDLNVLIGANGAGKSNFISAFELLGRIVDEDLALYVGRRGGASALSFANGSTDKPVVFDVTFEPYGYRAELVPSGRDEFLFAGEQIRNRSAGKDDPSVVTIHSGSRETALRGVLVERGVPSVADPVLDTLRGCRVFHFHDTSINAPVKKRRDSADNLTLRQDAANLAPFLRGIRERQPAQYERIRSTVAQAAPFFRDFVLEEDFPGSMILRWRQVGSDGIFGADAFSDGTLRYVCLVTLLLQPDPPPLIVLDEPELGLHPFAIVRVAEMLRVASRTSQILVATQSVALINEFEVEDLVVVERQDGRSTFRRRDAAEFAGWLEEYSLGEIWEKNLLGGRPTREPDAAADR
jgi:predicted ATPase